MNAGRILRKAGLDGDELRAAIAPVDPDTVNVWPASRSMMRLWRRGIKGVTIRSWVFVDPEILRGDADRLGRLVIHELVHVRQFNESGYVPFSLRYVYEYLGGVLQGKGLRQAYLDISAEQEARAVTEALLHPV
ncbi:MAG TPA: hypothetical protein VFZ80_03255 [Acidimicrobiia bacterium]